MGDARKSSFPGTYPKSGAIFMTDYADKIDFLRRKVFALPSSQSYFMKHVKDGMYLFLFEFERRELHGVFRACTDGAMNILPHVFSSSGKPLPAQVKFTLMWDCDPLSENEFRDAIRENYYSKFKFNFGLSQDQVRRLLSLFNLKRFKDQAPERQLTGSIFARQSGYSTSKSRRLADTSPMRNQVLDERGVDKHHGPDISTTHRGDFFYKDDRPSDDGRFGTYKNVGYEHKASDFLNECFRDLMGTVGGNIVPGEYATSGRVDTEWKTDIQLQPAVSVGCSSGNFRSISDYVSAAKSDRTETKYYKDDGFAPTMSTAYPSSFQSNVNPLVYPSKRVLETDSFIDDPIRPSSTFLPSMERQNPIASYPMNLEDSLVTSSLPCNPDVPAMNYRGSSSLGFNKGHASLQEYTSHDSFVDHVIGTSQNQSFPSLLETRKTAITSDVHSGSRDFNTLPYSNSYEHPRRTSLQRPDYLDDLAAEYSKKECYGDLPFLERSLAPVPSDEISYNARIDEHSSSYRTSPSKFPSLTYSDRYPTLLQDRQDFLMPERESDAQSGNDGFMLKECQPRGESFYNDNRMIEDGRFAIYNKVEYGSREDQQHLHVHEPIDVDHHGVTSLHPGLYQSSDRKPPPYQKSNRNRAPSQKSNGNTALYHNSDRRKKRSSVFSRLALPPKIRKQNSNIPLSASNIDRHISVNEVMDMLQQSRNNWVKTGCKQLVKHNDDTTNFRDKKQATRKEGSAMNSKAMNLKSTSSRKENSIQKPGETAFVTSSRKENSSQKTGDSAFVTSSRKENSNQKTGETTLVTSYLKENVSQKTGETTFVDFKRRSAVRKNLEDGKPGSHCETLNDKSAPAAQYKKRRLIRPEFRENESFDRGISGDAPELIVVPPTECSVNKNAESMISVDDVNEKDISPNALCQPAVKGNNSDKESGSNSEQFGVESFINPRSADEGGKESSKDHCISSMLSISHGDKHVEFEQDMTTSDIGIDGLSKDRNDMSRSTHKSSPKICEQNGDGDAKREFVYSISSTTSISHGVTHVEIEQDMTTRDIGIDGLCKDRNDVSRYTHESSPKIREHNDGDGALKREFVCSMTSISRGDKHVEIEQDMTTSDMQIDGLSEDRNDVSRSTLESSPKICEHIDGDGASKREFVYSISSMSSISCGGKHVGIEQDMTASDIGIDGLSKDQNDLSLSIQESSPKICEDNDGDGAAKREFVYNILSMTPISREDKHVEIKQDMTTSYIGIDGLSKDRNDVSSSTRESSPKICEDNDGDGAAKREFVYSIENMNDLTPVGGEIPISTLN